MITINLCGYVITIRKKDEKVDNNTQDDEKIDYNSLLHFLEKSEIKERDKLILETEINLMQMFPFVSERRIKVHEGELLAKILSQLPTVVVNSWDSYYYILKKEDFLHIHKKIYLSKLDYIKEVFDCDDFAMLMTILFSSILNINSVAFALGYINNSIPHAFNLVMLKDKSEIKPYILEPQTGEIKEARGRVFLNGRVYEIKEIFLL